MEQYLLAQGNEPDLRKITETMRWSEPSRDVSLVKKIALPFLERHRLFCVWSGRRLNETSFDVDHCFPWSAWPCDDLWNLFPSHREVNRQKKAKIPSALVISEAEERMMEWWRLAYSENEIFQVKRRFFVEAGGTVGLRIHGFHWKTLFWLCLLSGSPFELIKELRNGRGQEGLWASIEKNLL